jgi:uncharacterized protein YbjT (DUF2867 family)
MKVVIFGATGMVGAGALLEALASAEVESVLVVTRAPTGRRHPKLREVLHSDFLDFTSLRGEFARMDACFWCLGVTSLGLDEAAYARVTHDFTLAAARVMAEANPKMTFCLVTGAGTDAESRTMWARVKGRTENDVFALGFKGAYAFRPGFIQPVGGVRSRTRLYQAFYDLFGLLMPLLRRAAPGYVTTTANIGRAMLRVAREGVARRVLTPADINVLAR